MSCDKKVAKAQKEQAVAEEKKKDKKTDVKAIIKELGDTNFSGSNEEQGKMVQLMRGLAFSDDPMANKFMKAMDKAATEIQKKLSNGDEKKDEAVILTADRVIRFEEDGYELEPGDQVQLLHDDPA